MNFTHTGKPRPNEVICAKILLEVARECSACFDAIILNGGVGNGAGQAVLFPRDPVDSVRAAFCCVGVFPVPSAYVPASYLS